MKMQDKIVINDYIENDPLSEENLDKALETVNRFRLSLPNKTIWLYTGYEVNLEFYEISTIDKEYAKTRYEFTTTQPNRSNTANFLRKSILNNVDVLVDGRYIDSQRDVNLKWRGSKNQRVIDIQQSLQKGEIVLWTE